MNKTFLIKGEPIELTDDQLREYLLGSEPAEQLPLTLLDSIINSAIASTLAFGRAQFNTAKDAKEMMNASQMLSDTLVRAVKYSVQDYIEQLIIEKLELATPSNKKE